MGDKFAKLRRVREFIEAPPILFAFQSGAGR